MRKLVIVGIVAAAALAVWAASRSKCRYCESESYGKGCWYGPDGVHRHTDTDKYCEFCGSESYGRGCWYSLVKDDSGSEIHVHGHGNNKCVYCGSDSTGKGCWYAPNGVHAR